MTEHETKDFNWKTIPIHGITDEEIWLAFMATEEKICVKHTVKTNGKIDKKKTEKANKKLQEELNEKWIQFQLNYKTEQYRRQGIVKLKGRDNTNPYTKNYTIDLTPKARKEYEKKHGIKTEKR